MLVKSALRRDYRTQYFLLQILPFSELLPTDRSLADHGARHHASFSATVVSLWRERQQTHIVPAID